MDNEQLGIILNLRDMANQYRFDDKVLTERSRSHAQDLEIRIRHEEVKSRLAAALADQANAQYTATVKKKSRQGKGRAA